MTTRSNSAVVRNPLLTLAAAKRIAALPPEAKAAVRDLMIEIALDARGRANECWAKHKAPMACYWKAVSVYAGHASRLAKDRS